MKAEVKPGKHDHKENRRRHKGKGACESAQGAVQPVPDEKGCIYRKGAKHLPKPDTVKKLLHFHYASLEYEIPFHHGNHRHSAPEAYSADFQKIEEQGRQRKCRPRFLMRTLREDFFRIAPRDLSVSHCLRPSLFRHMECRAHVHP